MRIFLTGASGYIGAAIARALLKAGHEIVGLTHSPQKIPRLDQMGVSPVYGDIQSPGSWLRQAAGCDALIHAAFDYGPRGPQADWTALKALLSVARSPGRRRLLVYTSGVWTLGEQSDAPADERTPPRPLPLVRWRPLHEQMILESADSSLDAVVVRPGCVYGDRQGLYGLLWNSAVEKHAVPVVAGGRNRWASVYLDDLAELYRLIVEKRPPRALYHATDGSAETLRQVAEAFLDAAGGGEVEDVSLEQARQTLGPLAEGWALDQLISSEKARRQLGWRPTLTSAAKNAMSLLVQWKEQPGPVSAA